jgi:hypothetical protein
MLQWDDVGGLSNAQIACIYMRMGGDDRPKDLRWGIAAVALALLAASLVAVYRAERPAGREPLPEAKTAAPNRRPPPADRGARSPTAVPPVTGGDSEEVDDTAQPGPETAAANAYPVDLARLREKLPGNMYFRLGEPTEDPAVLEMRAEEERRVNELFGKVQSSTASEEEIHQYYAYRRELSEDYIEFSRLVLEMYGDELPDRDHGLYELSIKMHKGRLDAIPRQIEDALERKRAHDERRRQWAEDGGPE